MHPAARFLLLSTWILSACGGRTDLAATAERPKGATPDGGAGGSGSTADAAAGTVSRAQGRASHCAYRGFAASVAYIVPDEPRSIAAFDRTRDGHRDLVVVGWDGQSATAAQLLANRGDGTFERSAPTVLYEDSTGQVVSGDLDGDGRADVATVRESELTVHRGQPDGDFATPATSSKMPRESAYLASADFDGDGRPDLAFAGFDELAFGASHRIGRRPADFTVGLLSNQRSGWALSGPSRTVDYRIQDLATGDFDGDGHPDIVALTEAGAGGLSVFFDFGTSREPFEQSTVLNSSGPGYGLGVADFDGDGLDDVATTTLLDPHESPLSALAVFRGAGRGPLQGPAIDALPMPPSIPTVAAGDFNGDGAPDLAMVVATAPDRPVQVAVYPNLGDGTFGAPSLYPAGGPELAHATAFAAGDFNGDGIADLAVSTSGEQSPYRTTVNVLSSICQ